MKYPLSFVGKIWLHEMKNITVLILLILTFSSNTPVTTSSGNSASCQSLNERTGLLCMNGGTCVSVRDGDTAAKCHCLKGFTGRNCEIGLTSNSGMNLWNTRPEGPRGSVVDLSTIPSTVWQLHPQGPARSMVNVNSNIKNLPTDSEDSNFLPEGPRNIRNADSNRKYQSKASTDWDRRPQGPRSLFVNANPNSKGKPIASADWHRSPEGPRSIFLNANSKRKDERNVTDWNPFPEGPERNIVIVNSKAKDEHADWNLLPKGPEASINDINKSTFNSGTADSDAWNRLPLGPRDSINEINEGTPTPVTLNVWNILPKGPEDSVNLIKNGKTKPIASNAWNHHPEGPREYMNDIKKGTPIPVISNEVFQDSISNIKKDSPTAANSEAWNVVPEGQRLAIDDIKQNKTDGINSTDWHMQPEGRQKSRPAEESSETKESVKPVFSLLPQGRRTVIGKNIPISTASTNWHLLPEKPRESIRDIIGNDQKETTSNVWNLQPKPVPLVQLVVSTEQIEPIDSFEYSSTDPSVSSPWHLLPEGPHASVNLGHNTTKPTDSIAWHSLPQGPNQTTDEDTKKEIMETTVSHEWHLLPKGPEDSIHGIDKADNTSKIVSVTSNILYTLPEGPEEFIGNIETSTVKPDNSQVSTRLPKRPQDSVTSTGTSTNGTVSATSTEWHLLPEGSQDSVDTDNDVPDPKSSPLNVQHFSADDTAAAATKWHPLPEGPQQNTYISVTTMESIPSRSELTEEPGTPDDNENVIEIQPPRLSPEDEYILIKKLKPSKPVSGQIHPCKKFEKKFGEKPCLNGGKCYQTDDVSFECECQEKFTGESCEFVNACASSPCKNGGTCQSFEDSGVCNCLVGYSGSVCEIKESLTIEGIVDENFDAAVLTSTDKVNTTPSPTTKKVKTTKRTKHDVADPCYVPSYVSEKRCLNGGTCITLKDKKSYECECPDNFTGPFCQFINACNISPCKNGGTCESYEDSGVCSCPIGYTGTFCEHVDNLPQRQTTIKELEFDIDLTTPQPFIETTTPGPCRKALENGNQTCKNKGKCNPIDDKSYECECTKEFTGEFCQFKNLCFDFPCQNGGTCEAFDDSAVCTCPTGVIGTLCETDTSPTESPIVPDTTQGHLNNRKSKFTRRRRLRNKKGKHHFDPCTESEAGDRCLNGGTCLPLQDKKSYECECTEKFIGKYCQFVNACAKSPCINGGTCESYEDSGICKCPNGFRGTLCEQIDDKSSFASKKGLRFSKRRETVISAIFDNCVNAEIDDSKPHCLNGAKCLLLDDDDEGGYACECTDKFTGPLCQYLNACASAPCINGGTCESYEETAICICPKEFHGTYCEELDHEDQANLILATSEEADNLKLEKESVFDHIYRSKLRDKPPYPLYMQMKTQHFETQTGAAPSPPEPEPVIPIPGFENITKDMIRIAKDGTIYIRKPKKLSKSKHTKYKVTTYPPSQTSTEEEERDEVEDQQLTESDTAGSITERQLRSLDATIVKVMPNGELFIKVKVPKDQHLKAGVHFKI